jgi:hypothetical protein
LTSLRKLAGSLLEARRQAKGQILWTTVSVRIDLTGSVFKVGREVLRGLIFRRLPISSRDGMGHGVRDYHFVLPTDDYRLLKECLVRHSTGYNALDRAVPEGDEKRAFTCSENELQDVIQSVGHKFPLARVLATLIGQQWQPISNSRDKKPKKPKKR